MCNIRSDFFFCISSPGNLKLSVSMITKSNQLNKTLALHVQILRKHNYNNMNLETLPNIFLISKY